MIWDLGSGIDRSGIWDRSDLGFDIGSGINDRFRHFYTARKSNHLSRREIKFLKEAILEWNQFALYEVTSI